MAKQMRALTDSQARRCEEAVCKACKCRCHGRFHGSARSKAGAGVSDTALAALPIVSCDCLKRIEAGTHPKACQCACHPAYRAFFESLPAEDPHHLPTKEERAARRRTRNRSTARKPRFSSPYVQLELIGA